MPLTSVDNLNFHVWVAERKLLFQSKNLIDTNVFVIHENAKYTQTVKQYGTKLVKNVKNKAPNVFQLHRFHSLFKKSLARLGWIKVKT